MTTDQTQQAGADNNQEYLTFSLGNEQYGVDILKVQEIRGWEPLREMPDAPAYYKGVLDFRGHILPVVDLRIRFGEEQVNYKSTTVIIVLNNDDADNMMGVVVDAVSDVLTVRQSEIKAAPDMGSRIKTDYVLGMVSRADDMIMLVDAERLIDVEELEVADTVC
ncbi:MAG: chemotaxis protein CheW [Gammaproteobacteria bacterium]|nr:chemotaxis protein CheW [Gammaproteobacteria bacterium]